LVSNYGSVLISAKGLQKLPREVGETEFVLLPGCPRGSQEVADQSAVKKVRFRYFDNHFECWCVPCQEMMDDVAGYMTESQDALSQKNQKMSGGHRHLLFGAYHAG